MGSYNKTEKINKNCLQCKKLFLTTGYLLSINKGKFCSIVCSNKNKTGTKQKPETTEKIRLANTGKKRSEEFCRQVSIRRKNIKLSDSTREAIRNSLLGRKLSEETKQKIKLKAKRGKEHHFWGKNHSGVNNARWIEDRTKLAKRQERNDMAYKEWRKQVWVRDNYKCRIKDKNCLGKIEAHHILGWTEYPELRYQINNGITLCHAHHPRKRAEEKRLIPTFMELVSVSK